MAGMLRNLSSSSKEPESAGAEGAGAGGMGGT